MYCVLEYKVILIENILTYMINLFQNFNLSFSISSGCLVARRKNMLAILVVVNSS